MKRDFLLSLGAGTAAGLLAAFFGVFIFSAQSPFSAPASSFMANISSNFLSERTNPLAGKSIYRYPGAQVQGWVEECRQTKTCEVSPQELQLIEQRIARMPGSVWLNDEWYENVEDFVSGVVQDAARKNEVPVLVAYNIYQRDYGWYSAGGARTPREYRQWIQDLAEGIGNHEAVVILEPDALASLSSLSQRNRETRLELLGDAVTALGENQNTHVYIDAGNVTWHDAFDVAGLLKSVGIEKAQGFALNVSNFFTNRQNILYGTTISVLTNGSHFVVDTSQNGNGIYETNEAEPWCNPPGRALGTRPTTNTGIALADAYLWVKAPGESAGDCRGGPAAGVFWPSYALGLITNAQ